jgi:hypothetical protein
MHKEGRKEEIKKERKTECLYFERLYFINPFTYKGEVPVLN